MGSSIIRCNLLRIIHKISFGIQVSIADPVIEILERFFVSPEKLDAASIPTTPVIVSEVVVTERNRLNQIFIFLIIGFHPEYPFPGHFLIVQNVLYRLGKL